MLDRPMTKGRLTWNLHLLRSFTRALAGDFPVAEHNGEIHPLPASAPLFPDP